MKRELLTGGGLNQVFKVGDTVHRPVAPWTPRVHELLRHLAPLGFSPRVHGVQGDQEVLSYLEGEVGHPPLPEHLRGDDVLVTAARMLRQLHDASLDLVDRDGWQFARRSPAEVICHGDFAPYNLVFADGLPVGVIDFDTAHPAPRWWDVSYACQTFTLEFGTPAEQLRRMEVFCSAYGCSTDGLVDQILVRLADMVRMIRENPAFVIQREEKHDEYYLRLATYVRTNLA